MNFTRISRGAIRSKLLIKSKLENYSQLSSNSLIRFGKTSAISFLSAYMVAIPVASLRSRVMPSFTTISSAKAATVVADNSEPPSYTKDVNFIPNSGIQVYLPELSPIKVGESLDDQQKQAAAEAAAKAAAQAAAEAAAQAAAAKEAAENAANYQLYLASITPVSDIEQKLHDATVNAFGAQEWPAMYSIVSRESGFNPNSTNAYSGACGLFQANPCYKLPSHLVDDQINWGISYIRSRYGTPSNAWRFWLNNHWY